MAKKHFWKIWLRPNLLTKDVDNDYVAEVSTIGNTLHTEDVAQAIKDGGSELQYETLLDILNHSDRLRRERIQQGYSVQTGVCHIAPRVTGNWIGSAQPFNPEVHKITCDMTASAELRHALEDVSVEVLGVRDSGARIGLVTDVTTGKTDGTLTSGGDIIIDGEKIKIAPFDLTGLGVFLTPGTSTTLIPIDKPYVQNDPKKVVCRVPALGTGTYGLRIVTQFSNGTTLLKSPRTITYELLLRVL
ncbi:MAG: DUF4469 domain-containing protein [Prevotellaceae bacterium]|jgi:hypothetical protein|nr:DUF4469 domain-containing protein [Prevotellaceae bacterium]